MKEPITKFNKKNYYNDKIKAKLDELKVLCNNEKLPFFFAVAVNSTEKKTEYEYEFIGTNPNEIYLKDDKIVDFVNVVNGFDVVPPKKIIDIDYDVDYMEGLPTSDDDEDDDED